MATTLFIDEELRVSEGTARWVYRHPNDPQKLLKVYSPSWKRSSTPYHVGDNYERSQSTYAFSIIAMTPYASISPTYMVT